MSDKLLQQILTTVERMNKKIDHLESKMDKQFEEVKSSIQSQHVENINSDDLILRSLDDLKESVRYVNRKIADTELDVHTMKKALKQ